MPHQVLQIYDAYDRQPREVAEDFARTWWPDGPREIESFDEDDCYFRLVHGTRTYRVVYDPGVHLVSIPTYQVIVLD